MALEQPDLEQPAVFIVDPFNVDVYSAIANAFSKVKVLVLQYTLFEQKEKSSIV